MKRTILALGVAAALFATSATASADPGRGHGGGHHNGGLSRGGFGYAPGIHLMASMTTGRTCRQ